jgi:hypothetical protein
MTLCLDIPDNIYHQLERIAKRHGIAIEVLMSKNLNDIYIGEVNELLGGVSPLAADDFIRLLGNYGKGNSARDDDK